MSMQRIILFAVALLAALGAMLFVRGAMNTRKARSPAAAVAEAQLGARVLVAAKDVQAGAVLQAADLAWKPWAEEAMSPNFISEKTEPKAIETWTGAVARQSLAAGEPLISTRIVKPGEQGFMAAIVSPGYRAVAVPISIETAASGFILPNDRVDVLLTRKVTILAVGGASNEEVRSGIVLQNVRVLAIDEVFRAPPKSKEPERTKSNVALLELTSRDAELLAKADEMGDISLALRSVQNDQLGPAGPRGEGAAALEQYANGARDQIRIHSFGTAKDTDVIATGASQ